MPGEASNVGQNKLKFRGIDIQPPQTPEASDWQGPMEDRRSGGQKVAQAIIDPAFDIIRGMVMGGAEDPGMSFQNFGELLGAAPPIAAGTMLPGFFSRVNKLAQGLPKSINPGKALQMFRGATSPEELAFRKVPELLSGADQSKQITKDAILGHLDTNPPPDVKRVTLGNVELNPESNLSFDDWYYRRYATRPTPDNREAARPEYDEYLNIGKPTKYGAYQIPGGENYRETLHVLDRPKTAPKAEMEGFFAPGVGTDPVPAFTGPHFDEPNILVHTRHNDRHLPPTSEQLTPLKQGVDTAMAQASESFGPDSFGALQDARAKLDAAKGSKGRLIENIQSDWLQKGQKEGFANPMPPAELEAVMDTHMRAVEAEEAYKRTLREKYAPEQREHFGSQLSQMLWPYADDVERAELMRLQEASRQAYSVANVAEKRSQGVPDPGILKDNKWVDLGLKQQVLDVAQSPDLEWLGIAPGHVLRSRGEEVPDAFQEGIVPNKLRKILAPFGGKLERATLDKKPVNPDTDVDFRGVWRQENGIESSHPPGDIHEVTIHGQPVASTLPGAGVDEAEQLMQVIQGQVGQGYNPTGIEAFIARLTPEMKARIQKEGLPLLMALFAAHQGMQPSGEASRAKSAILQQ